MKLATGQSQSPSFWISTLLRLKSYITSYNLRFRAYVEPFLQPLFPAWSAEKNRARVQKVTFLGDSFVHLCLKAPRKWSGFLSGQHVQLGILKDGAELRRSFSISSGLPQFKKDRTIELTIQIQKGGRVTPWIQEFLKSGKRVTLSRAKGAFIIDPSRPALLIAGGSGVTPFHSFLRGEVLNPTVLLHYSKDPSLFSEIKAVENTDIHTIDTTKSGRFSVADLQRFCPDFKAFEIYLCGPGKMISDVRNTLLAQGCDPKNIHAEYFGAPPEATDLDVSSNVHFSKTGTKTKGDKRNLLELAESVGLTPVFGCRMGVCHQCKCSKKQGVVFNTRTQQHSDAGPEEIQLCVSVPVKDVVINL